MTVLTSLFCTLLVLAAVLIALSYTLIRRLSTFRRVESRTERINDALELLTEATETGFRSTGAELQRVAAVQRHTHDPLELQRRIERAVAAGESVQDIASGEGIAEGEARLRLHLSKARADLSALKENHGGSL